MRKNSGMAPAALAMLVGSVALGGVASAQVAEVGRRLIPEIAHLTFGSLCDDKFVIRNDGPNPVTLEYAPSKSRERVSLNLAGRELVELESTSRDELELWMNGKLVARAEKEGRKCKDLPGDALVVIAPLNGPSSDRDDLNQRGLRNSTQFGVGFGRGAFFDPWYAPFGAFGWGYAPFYSGFYGAPIIIGGRRR
jgi:hypothetical protein